MPPKNSSTPLTGLLRKVASGDKDEARIERQKRLLEKITTSSSQYEYLTSRYSVEKLDKMIKALEHYKYGVNAVAPAVCFGPSKCPFFHACPIGNGFTKDAKTGIMIPSYDDIEDFPVGNQCIVEKVFVEQKLIDYVQEFDVDPASPSELSLINDLALCDLYKNRAMLFMAGGDRDGEGVDFMKADRSSSSGAVSSETVSYKEHPVFSVIDKLEKRRHKILEELLATRKTRAVAAARFGTGIQNSQLMTEIERLRKAIEMKKAIPVDVKTSEIREDSSNLMEGSSNETVIDIEQEFIELD